MAFIYTKNKRYIDEKENIPSTSTASDAPTLTPQGLPDDDRPAQLSTQGRRTPIRNPIYKKKADARVKQPSARKSTPKRPPARRSMFDVKKGHHHKGKNKKARVNFNP